MEEKEKRFHLLQWPWNILLYLLLAVVLRLFAVPVILVLLGIGRKSNPHGVAEGYCLTRTRKRIVWFFWALLILLIGAALAFVFWEGLQQERTYWETMDYVTLAVSGGGSVLFACLGIYLGFTALRDAFFPAKSALARSIRSQLPFPDEAPPVEELFAAVDRDLQEHGQWFESVGIGREWVLGDAVNRIDRIRGIFTVDEIHTHSTKNGTRTSRTLQLVLIDDRWQRTAADFKTPGELQAAAQCLALRMPDARQGDGAAAGAFWKLDESAREEFEREFAGKQNRRASEQAQREALGRGPQEMILRQADGEVTSRVTLTLVEQQLRLCLSGGGEGFVLTHTRPVQEGTRAYQSLRCTGRPGQTGRVWLQLEPASSGGEALKLEAPSGQAQEILQGFFYRQLPKPEGWQAQRPSAARAAVAKRQPQPSQARLRLVRSSGAAQSHTTFTAEDIEAAAKGLADGTYQLAELTLPGGFLWIRVTAGDKLDARCTVDATRPDGEKLRMFTAKASPRQAAAWLTDYAGGRFLPGGRGWKDCTRQMEKSRR